MIKNIRMQRARQTVVKPLNSPTKSPLYHTTQWAKAASAFVRQYPLCIWCLAHGKTNEGAAEHALERQRNLVVDHIDKHAGDGDLFWNQNNWQTLCRYPCHDKIKRRHELHNGSGASWLRRVACVVRRMGSWPLWQDMEPYVPPATYSAVSEQHKYVRVVVVGPPCSGKTTWVQGRANDGDLVWDFDDAAMAMLNRDSKGGLSRQQVEQVNRMRSHVISKAQHEACNVYWITSRLWDANQVADVIGAEVIVMDTPQHVCEARCEREHGAGTASRQAAIARWFEESHPRVGGVRC